jgi:hypothetical protein
LTLSDRESRNRLSDEASVGIAAGIRGLYRQCDQRLAGRLHHHAAAHWLDGVVAVPEAGKRAKMTIYGTALIALLYAIEIAVFWKIL